MIKKFFIYKIPCRSSSRLKEILKIDDWWSLLDNIEEYCSGFMFEGKKGKCYIVVDRLIECEHLFIRIHHYDQEFRPFYVNYVSCFEIPTKECCSINSVFFENFFGDNKIIVSHYQEALQRRLLESDLL